MPRSVSSPLPVDAAPNAEASDPGAALLARCQQRDERALAELIQAYQQRVYRLALRVCGDAGLAEEAAVDSFYKVWTKASQWRGQTGAETWIYRIAVRTVLDLRRGRRRWWQRLRAVSLWDDEDPAPGPAEESMACEERQATREQLEQALSTLKSEDRLLVHLYYDEAKSLPQIAEILDVPAANLKMRLARARQRLRVALSAQAQE